MRMLAGAGLATPALLGGSGCAPALIRTDDATGLSLCYVAGDVSANGAVVWLRAEPESRVSLHYSKDPSFAQSSTIGPFVVDGRADHTLSIELDKLDSATTYYYSATVAGKKPGYVAKFTTAPRPDDLAKVSFCFSGDSRESYQPFTVMNAVRANRPDFFLHLGDTIYADLGGRCRQVGQFWAKYRANRNDAATQRLFFETSTYVIWDDHEVENNYLPEHPLASVGRQAFLDYWPIRRNPHERGRIYRSFRWGKAMELFLLDSRQYRDPKAGTMLGMAQKQWLLESLGKSTALFKFIATPVPMAGGGRDRWDGYPKERAEIIRFINENNIKGAVFLSADLHYAAITRIPKSHGLKDITAGPIAAPLNRITNGTARRFEYFSADNFNFAKITVDPNAEPASALVELIDQDDRLLHRTIIKAA